MLYTLHELSEFSFFPSQRASEEDIGRTCTTQQRSSSGGDPLEIQQVPKILFHYKIWHSPDLRYRFEALYYVITASKHKLFYLWIASNFFYLWIASNFFIRKILLYILLLYTTLIIVYFLRADCNTFAPTKF